MSAVPAVAAAAPSTSLPLEEPWGRRSLIAMLTLASAALAGTAASHEPLLAVGGALLLVCAVAALARPDVLTLAVIAVVYTNAAGIAVQRGVPVVVGAALPVALLLPLTRHLVLRRERFVVTPIVPLMLAFLAVQTFGALLSSNTPHALTAVATYLVEGLVLYLLLTNVIRTYRLLRVAVWTLVLAGAFLGALALHQQLTGNYGSDYGGFAQVSNAAFGGDASLGQADTQPRLAGPINQQNYHAQIMLMLVPLALMRVLGERSLRVKFAAAGLTALVAIGIALTFSRGAAVGFALLFVIATAFGYLSFRQLVVIVAGALLLMQLVPQYGVRLNSLTAVVRGVTASDGNPGLEAADGASRQRFTEMTTAARVFADHPVIGVGPSMFRFYYADYADGVGLRVKGGPRVAHDMYLEMAADTGIVGLGLFLAIVAMTLRALNRTRKRWRERHPELANMATGFLLAISSYLATGLFLSMAFVRYFWLIMALAWVTCLLRPDAASTDVARVSTRGRAGVDR